MRWEGERESSEVEDRRGMRIGRGGARSAAAGSYWCCCSRCSPAPIRARCSRSRRASPTSARVRPRRSRDPWVRRRTRRAASRRSCSARPKTSGARSSPRRGAATSDPAWCCSRTRCSRRAARPNRRSDPSTARTIRRCTSTSSFFQELEQRFGAPGDFARAYVIAHEIGHHVQNQLGLAEKVSAAQRTARPRRPTRCRCAWSCRPTAWPASGATAPTANATGWTPATSRRAWRPPRRSATTPCSASRAARCSPRAGPTAPRRCASAGCVAGLDSGDIDACQTFDDQPL